MTDIKLCKDCKWYRKDWISHILNGTHHYDTCASPNTTQNPVTGNENRFCDMLRAERWKELDYSCGPEGRYWEARK
jgi:hypothetical protein